MTTIRILSKMIANTNNNLIYNIEAAIIYNILSYPTYRKEIFDLCKEIDFTSQSRYLFVELHKAYANDIIDTIDFKQPFMTDWHEIIKQANGKRWPLVKIDFFDRSLRRHGKNKAEMLTMWFSDPTTPIADIQRATKELIEIVNDSRVYKQPLKSIKHILNSSFDQMERKMNGDFEFVKWGIELLDTECPAEAQDFNIIAARAGIGKTVVAMNCLLNASLHHPVAYWCGEMSDPVIGNRLLSILTGVLHERIRDPQKFQPGELQRIIEAVKDAQNRNIWVSTNVGDTVEDIRQWIKQLVEYKGVKHVFIDYIQRIRATNSKMPRRDQVQHMSNELKNIAAEFNITITALAQLNRECSGERPKVNHLAECGFLEQDASTVVLVDRIRNGETLKNRNYKYRVPGTTRMDSCTIEQLKDTMIFLIAKSRHAAEWTLYADCDLSTFTIGGRKQFEGDFAKRNNYR